jgi:hypothetical protein
MSDRWGISIDVEGFSKNYEFSEERKTYAILALGELMRAIYQVGTRCFPGTPEKNYSERLFAHQFGDGFLVCSDFHEPDGSRAIAIAAALLRHMALKGYVAKAAIATGDLSGISGCYPQPMRDAAGDSVGMGMGLMTTIGVMGTALTKAHKLGASARGAVLVVDQKLLEKGIPPGAVVCGSTGNCIDWVSSNMPLVSEIAAKSGLSVAGAEQIHAKLRAYCVTAPVPPQPWVEATFMCLSHGGA